ncbi:MAG: recombinase family protein [Microscillaceae bacterium]|jgi:DNA invertase Pin-like site-specific DNA recombinase|nr:recombinase family protein [Microscillaceae bacterium]
MKIGYVRVSKEEQNEQLQIDALKKYGCEKIFQEKISGTAKNRVEFERMKEVIRKGDELVVWDIDRLGRTTLELIMFVDELNQKGILFKSLSQSLIDTTTETGEFVFKLFALLAEHERKRLIRRTKAGQEAARARGRMGGRPKGLSPHYQEIAPLVISAYKEQRSIREIMKAFKIPSTTTVYKILYENGVNSQVYIKKAKTQ